MMPTKARREAEQRRAVAMMPVDETGAVIQGAGGYEIGGDPRDEGGELVEHMPPEQSSADRVMALLSEISADERAVVKVFRKLPNGKQAWCNDYTPGEFEQGGMTMIRRSWGPGDFVIVLYGGTPYRIKSRSEVHIDASREPEAPPPQTGMETLLRQMADGQAAMLRAITERPDPAASMRETLTMMTLMREAMGINGAPAQKSTVGELVDAIKELRGASDLIAGKDEPDSLLGIAKTFLPAIVQAAGNMRAGQQPAAAPAATMPLLAVPPSIAEKPPEDSMLGLSPESIAAFKLKAFVRALLLMSAGGDDTVETGAELVYEKIPDEALEVLEMPVWFAMFSEQFPEVVPHEAWLTKVRDRVLAMLDEPDDAAPVGGSADAP